MHTVPQLLLHKSLPWLSLLQLRCIYLHVFRTPHMANLYSAYHLNDAFAQARRNGILLHRVVENADGICERELKDVQKASRPRRTKGPARTRRIGMDIVFISMHLS